MEGMGMESSRHVDEALENFQSIGMSMMATSSGERRALVIPSYSYLDSKYKMIKI